MSSKNSSAVSCAWLPTFFSLRPRRKPGVVGIDQEQRDALGAEFGCGLGREQDQIGDDAVGDEDFRPVDAVAVAVALGMGANAGEIAAGIGFGQPDRGNGLALHHARQPGLPLPLGAEMGEEWRDDIGVHVPGGCCEAELP